MFSFAMTSGLASDSDKLKIIITLRRAQTFQGHRTVQNSDLLSVVGAIGRAGLNKGVKLHRPGSRGSKVLRC